MGACTCVCRDPAHDGAMLFVCMLPVSPSLAICVFCGAGAGSPRPHRPHPGHTGRRTLAARPRGREAGGGTAPDTTRPHNGGRPPPPGAGPPPPPRHAAPTGHAGQGDSVGPPHPHTRTYSTQVTDPNNPPSGRAVGGGIAPDLRRPSQRWKAPPPGTPFCHPHSEQRRPPRAHAVEPVLGLRARTDRTRNTLVAIPQLPAPEDRRSGEGQRLTPDAPQNSGRPPPPGDGPPPARGTHPHRACRLRGQRWAPTPTRPRPQHVVVDPKQSGEGERLKSDAPRNSGRHPPRDALPPPPRRATPARKGARSGAGAGSPRPHRPHLGHTGRGTPATRPRGRAAGGGTASDTGPPSQRWQATPPRGRLPSIPAARQCRTPTAAHPRPQHVSGGPRRPGQKAGDQGKGQHLTPDAPRNGGGPPPRGQPPPPPRSAAPTGHAS